MKVLSSKEFSHIISWLPSGKSFVILKPKLFTLQILPGHFKSAKYSSFTRKLHRWGFMRHYRGEEAGAFFHEDFQRGCLDLVEKMTCFKHNEQPAKPSPTLSRSQPTNESIMNAAVISKAHVAATSRSMPAPQVHPISTALPLQFTNVLERLNVYHRNANSLESSLNGIRQAGRSSLDPVSAMNAFRSQSMDVRPDLNAVIEMEVHWRVKERMDAAAVNRLVLMQQQAKFSGYPPILRPQAPFPPSPFVPAWNQPGSSMSWNRAALALAAQNLYATSGGNKQPPISHSAFGNLQSLAASLPPTNIQGAKTA